MYLVRNELTMVRTESSDTSLNEPTHILKLFTMLHKLYKSQYGHLYFTVTSPYLYTRTTTNSKILIPHGYMLRHVPQTRTKLSL